MAVLLVEWLYAHGGVAVVTILDRHAPRLAAHRTVLDIVLAIAAPRIERHGSRFAAVRTRDRSAGVTRTVAKRKVAIQVEFVAGLIVECETHSETYSACAARAPYN